MTQKIATTVGVWAMQITQEQAKSAYYELEDIGETDQRLDKLVGYYDKLLTNLEARDPRANEADWDRFGRRICFSLALVKAHRQYEQNLEPGHSSGYASFVFEDINHHSINNACALVPYNQRGALRPNSFFMLLLLQGESVGFKTAIDLFLREGRQQCTSLQRYLELRSYFGYGSSSSFREQVCLAVNAFAKKYYKQSLIQDIFNKLRRKPVFIQLVACSGVEELCAWFEKQHPLIGVVSPEEIKFIKREKFAKKYETDFLRYYCNGGFVRDLAVASMLGEFRDYFLIDGEGGRTEFNPALTTVAEVKHFLPDCFELVSDDLIEAAINRVRELQLDKLATKLIDGDRNRLLVCLALAVDSCDLKALLLTSNELDGAFLSSLSEGEVKVFLGKLRHEVQQKLGWRGVQQSLLALCDKETMQSEEFSIRSISA